MTPKRPCNKKAEVPAKKGKFSCDLCVYTSDRSNDLKRHYDCKHAEKKCACTQCGKSFGNEQLLGAHHKKAHVVEKNHACEDCDFRTSSACDLRRHREGKHADKNFACGQCDKKFGSRAHLECHVERVHGMTGKSTLANRKRGPQSS
ncbi:zinc finger and SCAN domain-containing protein 10 [Aphelenchoides avenae]|nr:zinc finger and SCAN domain-containing protein 10 [Aphelenchus avenae]